MSFLARMIDKLLSRDLKREAQSEREKGQTACHKRRLVMADRQAASETLIQMATPPVRKAAR